MKNLVPIRTYEREENGYKIYTIQVMQQRYKSDFMGMLETIGEITFQKSIGENYWYGMRFVANTSEFKIFNEFHKLVRKIHTTASTKPQPSEIINIINGKEHFLQNSEFFNQNDNGLECYNIMQGTVLYAKLIAHDYLDANIKLNKIKKKRLHNQDLTVGTSFKISV